MYIGLKPRAAQLFFMGTLGYDPLTRILSCSFVALVPNLAQLLHIHENCLSSMSQFCFPVAVIQHPDKSYLREKGSVLAHSSRVT